MIQTEKTKEVLTFRKPTIEDGGEIFTFIRACGSLDVNSPYCYLLQCAHFADTSVLAKDSSGNVVAYLSGYSPPLHSNVLFVWQIGVAAAWRKKGLAKTLIRHVLDRKESNHLEYVEATVTSSNSASQNLFTSFAKSLSAPLRKITFFEPDNFGPVDHEAEILFRIGPFNLK